jgi:threonine dehydrogenase-like Zn-dependent dehydrogenase
MKATVYHAAHDVRVENVPDPQMADPREAIVRVTRAAICGSDLWFYRGVTELTPGTQTGHEFVGVVESVGSEVHSVRAGDAVIAPFAWSDGTCEFCRAGLQTSCVHGDFFGSNGRGGQAEFVSVPYADATLVKMPETIAQQTDKLSASVTLCDVMGTGHHGVVRAQTAPGSTVVIVGDGAVGLCAVLSAAKIIGAERIVAVGHNRKRLLVAEGFGATHTFDSHDHGVRDEIIDLTSGGAPHVVEAVGNQESLELAIGVTRPGGSVSFVGVPHKVEKPPLSDIFNNNLSLRGGVAPVRAYLPELIASLETGTIDPSPVLDLELPLDRVADGYAAMDKRHAIKVLLTIGEK